MIVCDYWCLERVEQVRVFIQNMILVREYFIQVYYMLYLFWRACMYKDVFVGLWEVIKVCRVLVCFIVCVCMYMCVYIYVYVCYVGSFVCVWMFCVLSRRGAEGSILFFWVGRFVVQCFWESGVYCTFWCFLQSFCLQRLYS